MRALCLPLQTWCGVSLWTSGQSEAKQTAAPYSGAVRSTKHKTLNTHTCFSWRWSEAEKGKLDTELCVCACDEKGKKKGSDKACFSWLKKKRSKKTDIGLQMLPPKRLFAHHKQPSCLTMHSKHLQLEKHAGGELQDNVTTNKNMFSCENTLDL